MSANDIVLLFKELKIIDHIINVAGHDFNFWNEDELSCFLTYQPQEDILRRLLGSEDEITKEFNDIVNERILNFSTEDHE